MNPYLIAIIQGIVEGLTEFIPVSSTGHLILTGSLLGFTGEASKSFEIFIQLGAILAVAWLYRRHLWQILWRWHFKRDQGGLNVWHMALGMIPASVVGLLGFHAIKAYLFTPTTVLIGLVGGGIWMILVERFPRPVSAPTADSVTYLQALGIGCFQCLALWPGFSRSGATIAGALLLGLGLRAAADFSFMLAVPVMVAATGLDLFKSASSLPSSDVGMFAVGFLVSFVVGWLAVVWFLRLLVRVKLTPFAYYRFVVAAAFGLYFFR
ncbi:MAG: undecaprenyl-diphosphate phosphatase [Acidobacteriota bacterium]